MEKETVSFCSSFSFNSFKLLQLPKGLNLDLASTTNTESELKTFGEFVSNSELSQEVFFVTKDETFVLKRVENSNTILLREKNTSKIISGVDHSYLIQKTSPNFTKVKPLLEVTPISTSTLVQSGGVTLDEIRRHCISSEKELLAYLAEINAVKVLECTKRYAVLEREEKTSILNSLLMAVLQKNINLDEFTKEEVCLALSSFHEVCIKAVLLEFTEEANGKLSLNKKKLYQWKVEELLKDENQISLSNLISKVGNLLPKGILFEKDYLAGFGVTQNKLTIPDDESLYDNVLIKRLFAADLRHLSAKTLFNRLFLIKNEWHPDDIGVYVEHLITPELSKGKLFERFSTLCRSSADFSIKVYKKRK
eukprot:maker-scaffold_4-snap-gene-7.2-mRNA-1 protein AED:0.30 eAED:0.30 QI:31/1/1/1/1/1/3/86/364